MTKKASKTSKKVPQVILKVTKPSAAPAAPVARPPLQDLSATTNFKLSEAGKAHWTTADIKRLIEHVKTNKSKAGDGLSFKMTGPGGWNDCSVTMNKHRTLGGKKTAKACQQKWTSVSN